MLLPSLGLDFFNIDVGEVRNKGSETKKKN